MEINVIEFIEKLFKEEKVNHVRIMVEDIFGDYESRTHYIGKNSNVEEGFLKFDKSLRDELRGTDIPLSNLILTVFDDIGEDILEGISYDSVSEFINRHNPQF